MSERIIHHADFSLTEDEQAVAEAFSTFFDNESPPDLVRDAEPIGFDRALWEKLVAMRAVAMGVPQAAGGDGAGMVDLVLAGEPWGRRLGPVPLAEALVTARLLAAAASAAPDRVGASLLADVLDSGGIATLATEPSRPGVAQLVPAAAVADLVVALVGDDLVAARPDPRPEPVPNQGHTPLAWFDPSAGDPATLASGPAARRAYADALREWQLVMAAALTGMAEAVLAISVEHAKHRVAFGVPIGTFQAVAHPLVDVAMNVEMARRLTRKAAWWADTDRGAHRHLVPMAYRLAEEAAVHASTVGVHTLGGVGFTVESDVQLYFRRAKGWTLVANDPERRLDDVADELFGPTAPAIDEGVLV